MFEDQDGGMLDYYDLTTQRGKKGKKKVTKDKIEVLQPKGFNIEVTKVTREVGIDDAEGPPVPIPNTEVKLSGAENTWLVTARENREMPTQTVQA